MCVCVCVCVECALISFRLSERAPVLKSLKRDVSRELVSAWDWKSVCVSFSAQILTEEDRQLCADTFGFKNTFFKPQRANKTHKTCRFEVTDSSHLEFSQS